MFLPQNIEEFSLKVCFVAENKSRSSWLDCAFVRHFPQIIPQNKSKKTSSTTTFLHLYIFQ